MQCGRNVFPERPLCLNNSFCFIVYMLICMAAMFSDPNGTSLLKKAK